MISSSAARFMAALIGNLLLFGVIGPHVLAQSFDEPIQKEVVDYGLANPEESLSSHIKLSCFYYSRFMVKQYDVGEKGSEWLAISPMSQGALPKCSRIHGSQEKVIEKWTGYFKGVKGNSVFFNAEDAFNLGYPFAVFKATTGTKIFEDSSLLTPDGRDTLQAFEASDGTTIIRYTRVFPGNCSIPKEKAVCWEWFRKENRLPQSAIPICSGYDKNLGSLNEHYLDNPSVIGYPVEVNLSAGTPSVKIMPGPVTCWGAD